MEGKVPDAALSSELRNLLPSLTGNGDVQYDQLAHILRMSAGVGIGDRPAPVVSDQENLFEAELAHELIDIVGDGAFVVAGRRTRGIAQAAHVRSDDRVVLGQRRHDTAPFVPGLRPSMEQHDGIAASAGNVVEADVVEGNGVMDESGVVHFFSGSQSFCQARIPSARVFWRDSAWRRASSPKPAAPLIADSAALRRLSAQAAIGSAVVEEAEPAAPAIRRTSRSHSS